MSAQRANKAGGGKGVGPKAAAGTGGVLALVAVVLAVRLLGGPDLLSVLGPGENEPAVTGSAVGPPTDTAGRATDDTETVARLFRERVSDEIVTLPGRVRRALADDNEGSRHQKFILELTNGQTVLVSHNIDLAPRAPIHAGDRVTVHGEYEWSEQGGVVHWTHHDPDGRHEGGWIEHEGERYE